MKKTLCVIVLLVLCFLTTSSFAAVQEGDFRGIHWKFENGVLSFSGSGDVSEDGPWSSYVKKAKTLEFTGPDMNVDNIFRGCKNVSTIHIGKGVVRTGDYVFWEVGKKVKLIVDENDYIWNCESFTPTKITEIVLGEGVDNFVIEDGFVLDKNKEKLLMCYGKKKDIVVVPESVKILSTHVFARNEMKELRLPLGLEVIEDEAICYCPKLNQLTIPGSVKKIGAGVFAGNKKMTALNFVNPEISPDYHISPDYFVEMNSVKNLMIPNYGDISEVCVSTNKSLNYIVVSEGNTKLNGYNGNIYSEDCKKLIGIYLPKSLTDISVNNLPYDQSIWLYVIEGSYAQKFAEENSYPYKVITPIKNVILSEETLDLKIGKTTNLKATIEPADSTSRIVQWMSTNEAVATVDEGKIKAVGAGECDILCRGFDCGCVSAICHVTVAK